MHQTEAIPETDICRCEGIKLCESNWPSLYDISTEANTGSTLMDKSAEPVRSVTRYRVLVFTHEVFVHPHLYLEKGYC